MDDQATRQRIACKAVIAHQGKVLVLREAAYEDGSNAGRYHLPGGRVEMGEPYLEGLHREILEETGLKGVTVIKPIYVGEWSPVIKGEKTQIIAIFFACEATEVAIKLGNEHDDYQWVDAASLHELDLMDPEDKVLEAYFAEFSAES